MTTKAQTLAGSYLQISAAAPATQTLAGFQALSFTTIAEITDLGTGLGKKYTLVTHSPVGDRKKYKFRGDYDNGTLSLKMAKATLANTDAGQTILQAAANSDTSYSYSIVFQDGSRMFFSAKNMGFMTDMGTINNVLQSGTELQVDSDVFESAT